MATGTIGAHELVHKITGIPDLPLNPNNPTDLMSIDALRDQDMQGFTNLWTTDSFQLSTKEIGALQKACQNQK